MKARCYRCDKNIMHGMLIFCYHPGCGGALGSPVRCHNKKSHQNICGDCVLEDVQKARPAATARDLQDFEPLDGGNVRYATPMETRCSRCDKNMKHRMLIFCHHPGCGGGMDNPVRCYNKGVHPNICDDCVLEDGQKTRPAAASNMQDSGSSDGENVRYASYGQGDGRLMDEIIGTAAGIAIFSVLGIITGIIMGIILYGM